MPAPPLVSWRAEPSGREPGPTRTLPRPWPWPTSRRSAAPSATASARSCRTSRPSASRPTPSWTPGCWSASPPSCPTWRPRSRPGRVHPVPAGAAAAAAVRRAGHRRLQHRRGGGPVVGPPSHTARRPSTGGAERAGCGAGGPGRHRLPRPAHAGPELVRGGGLDRRGGPGRRRRGGGAHRHRRARRGRPGRVSRAWPSAGAALCARAVEAHSTFGGGAPRPALVGPAGLRGPGHRSVRGGPPARVGHHRHRLSVRPRDPHSRRSSAWWCWATGPATAGPAWPSSGSC